MCVINIRPKYITVSEHFKNSALIKRIVQLMLSIKHRVAGGASNIDSSIKCSIFKIYRNNVIDIKRKNE